MSKDLVLRPYLPSAISYKDHPIVEALFDACLLHSHVPDLFSVGTPREGRDGAQLVKKPIFQGPLN